MPFWVAGVFGPQGVVPTVLSILGVGAAGEILKACKNPSPDEKGRDAGSDGRDGAEVQRGDSGFVSGGDSGPSCMPAPEICDQRDNDCNGLVDEWADGTPLRIGRYEQQGDSCYIEIKACEGGEWIERGYQFASIFNGEICDGLDDDCDGTTDEDCIIPAIRDLDISGGRSCVVFLSGNIYCWGDSCLGNIRDGEEAEDGDWYFYSLPIQRTGIDDAVQIALSGFHTCALSSDETVKCWGLDSSGQLGVYPTEEMGRCGGMMRNHYSNSPITVPNLGGIRQVAVSGEHTCALNWEGGVSCWGYNSFGQTGSPESRVAAPSPVSGLEDVNIVQIALGNYFSCALDDGGTAYCWGYNIRGMLGDGTEDGRYTAQPVVQQGISKAWHSIAAGSFHACALAVDGELACWGENNNGQLGNGSTDNSPIPVPVAGIQGIDQFDLGGDYSCAVKDGALFCWGKAIGSTGGSIPDTPSAQYTIQHTPSRVEGIEGVERVAIRSSHSCAILRSGVLVCWGDCNLVGIGDESLPGRYCPPMRVNFEREDE